VFLLVLLNYKEFNNQITKTDDMATDFSTLVSPALFVDLDSSSATPRDLSSEQA
jgi:hypothetical protein